MILSDLITLWHKWGEIPPTAEPEPDPDPYHPVIEDVFRRPMPGRWEIQIPPPPPPSHYFSNRAICLYLTALLAMGSYILYVLFYVILIYDYCADPTLPLHPLCMVPSEVPSPLLDDRESGPHAFRQPFTLEHLTDAGMQPMRPNGTWSGGSRVHRNTVGDLVRFDGRTGAEHILLTADHPDLNMSRSHQISADGHFVLLERPAPRGGGSFYRLVSLDVVVPFVFVAVSLGVVGEPVDYAAFGPVGSQLVVVQNGHILYYPSGDATLPKRRQNYQPMPNIYRGICDWSYVELMFDGQPALWFSPDGQQLAYITFNDSALTERVLSWRAARPEIRWPRVNTDNPHVHVSVMNLNGEPRSGGALPQPQGLRNVAGQPLVLASVGWSGPDRLVTVWMNRQQTRAVVQSCSTGRPTVECFAITKINATGGWLRMSGPLFAEHDQLAVVQPFGSFNRLVIYLNTSDIDNIVVRPIVDQMHVERIVYFDRLANIYFYLGSTAAEPWDRHMYAVHGRNGSPHGTCLTCPFEWVAERRFTHFDAHFSGDPDNRLLMLELQGPAVPRHDIYEWSPDSDRVAVLQFCRELQTNDALAARLVNMRWAQPRWLHMRDTGNRIRLLVPPSSENETGDLPLLVQPYEGPGTYAGTSEWRLDWPAYMAANRSVIVAQIDGHGSGRSRLNNTHAVYGRLGWPEANDMRQAAIWLVQQLRSPNVEPRNIGIWGVGYAGFVAGMALARSDGMPLFECAALVEPLVDWSMATALYAERYMGLWNESAYRNVSLLANADRVRRNAMNMMLVHDNNTAGRYETTNRLSELAEQWTMEAKPNVREMVFKQAIYSQAKLNWTSTLTDFFDQCFDLFL